METPEPGSGMEREGTTRLREDGIIGEFHQITEVRIYILTYGLVFQRLIPSPNLGRFSQEQQKAHPKGLLHLPNFTTLLQTMEK